MRILMRTVMTFTLSSLLLTSLPGVALAQDVEMLIASDAAVEDHYPGPDGLVGNADDVVSDALSAINMSAPNTYGSYGFNAFKFVPLGPPDPNLPAGFDAITFVDGSVTIDKAIFESGGGSVIKALDVVAGTEPFPGHGAYTSTITAVNSGTYNTATDEFTLDADYEYTINGFTASEEGVVLTGTAIYQAAADFGTNTGNDYFENVVKPLATAKGATGAVFITGTGTLTSLGYEIQATLVALEGVMVTINAGMNDAWVNEHADFQGLFFTVFEDLSLFFLSWFTFDSVIPAQDTATFGASDHRWVTGLGSFEGNSVTVNVELTTGGIFNGSDPTASQEASYGTITIWFKNCNEAIVTYNFPGPGLSGQMVLKRVVTDNVELCKTLSGM